MADSNCFLINKLIKRDILRFASYNVIIPLVRYGDDLEKDLKNCKKCEDTSEIPVARHKSVSREKPFMGNYARPKAGGIGRNVEIRGFDR